ncbi:MAG: iron ABC transporter permease [Propionicimonas sp.]
MADTATVLEGPASAGPSRPPLKTRVRAWLEALWQNPTPVIAVMLAIALAYTVLGPILSIVSDAFRLSTIEAINSGGTPGALTLDHVERVFLSETGVQTFWNPLANTFTVGIFATGLALVFGLSLAMLVARTNVWGRSVLGFLLIIPYMLPSQAFATAWSTVFRNRRTGGALGMMEGAGLTPPDWLAYGPIPIAICLSLNYFPFAFLLFSNALNKIDIRLVEAAQVLGGKQHHIWIKVLLPLLIPTTMSVLLLTVARTLGTFATPFVLGNPIGYNLLSTSLYASIRSGNSGEASVLAIVLAAVGIAMVVVDMVLIRNWRRFVTVGGKGGGSSALALRTLRLPFTIYAWLVFGIAAVAPLVVMFLSTITRTPGVLRLDNITFQYWMPGNPESVFGNTQISSALTNTLLIAGGAALVCGIVGLLVGYVVVRMPGTFLSGFLRQISFMPYLIPGIAFAAAMLTLFAVPRGPIPALYGSIWLLVVVMIVTYLPYASRSGISSMMQIGTEPEEAAQVLGAGYWTRLFRVMAPLQKSALLTAIILPFISGMKELSLVVMLVTPGTETLTTQSLRFLDMGSPHLANATILIIGLVVMVAVLVVQRLTKVNIANGLGG